MAGVRTTHADYDRLLPYWTDCRNAVKGQRAMQAAGVLYLEKLQDETDEKYKARVRRSNFFNGTWRTIAGLKGMAFRIDPTADIPASVETLKEDITLSGVSLDAFASNIVEEVLEVGRVGILVDFPQPPENVTAITVARAESLGLRPTLQFYKAETIRNWKFSRINNAWVLTMVVLAECEAIPEDEFTAKDEDRYRVLDLDEAGRYRQRVFRINKKGEDELVEGPLYPQMSGKDMTFVPFVTVGATGKGDAIDEPPLSDLVDANIALYQVNSDRRHALHFTGMPTPVVSGYQKADGEKLYVGSTVAWVFPDPNATASFLEFEGKGLSESKDMSTELKQEMAMLGARMLADESRIGSETLGGTQIKHQGENSMLGEIVGHVSAAMEWAIGVFAKWAGGATRKVVYQINRKFLPVPMLPQEITALVGAWQQGAISERELFDKFQQGEVIRSDVQFEEHQANVEINTPSPARPTPTPEPGAAAA
jgi:hypothetical protein